MCRVDLCPSLQLDERLGAPPRRKGDARQVKMDERAVWDDDVRIGQSAP